MTYDQSTEPTPDDSGPEKPRFRPISCPFPEGSAAALEWARLAEVLVARRRRDLIHGGELRAHCERFQLARDADAEVERIGVLDASGKRNRAVRASAKEWAAVRRSIRKYGLALAVASVWDGRRRRTKNLKRAARRRATTEARGKQFPARAGQPLQDASDE
jgi:hypothetical protein